ncbi:MAG: hypothetical protein JSS72_04075 [Armatimonadetes bacterium]|nr:hypothetical protein [Armatimonadota bacterium]
MPAQTSPALKVGIVIAILHAVLAAIIVSLGYGFHRDEMYYLQCGEHLSLGYVDHPFLVPCLITW